jgi:hypothetical protein
MLTIKLSCLVYHIYILSPQQFGYSRHGPSGTRMLPVSVVSLQPNADEMDKKVPGAVNRATLRVSTRSSHACAPSGNPDLSARRVISWAKDMFSRPTAMTKGPSGRSAAAAGLRDERLRTCLHAGREPP